MLLFSLYPTDSPVARQVTILQALQQQIRTFFVSLHMPESQNLRLFLAELAQLHQVQQCQFYADISLHTLSMLTLSIDDLSSLRQVGIIGLRLDYGFSDAQIQQIRQQGFEMAINASTMTPAWLDSFSQTQTEPEKTWLAWHNFYPRPETGLSAAYFRHQNALARKHNLPIYAFIPGEQNWRAPLHFGLPTLETHRQTSAYLNYLSLKIHYGVPHIVIAEGTLSPQHLTWILRYEREGIVTIPVTHLRHDVWQALVGKTFYIRQEESDLSWRLEGSRGLPKVDVSVPENAGVRRRGSLQMDSLAYGRYAGEIHLIKQTSPPDARVVPIGDIAPAYQNILECLSHRPAVQFIQLT